MDTLYGGHDVDTLDGGEGDDFIDGGGSGSGAFGAALPDVLTGGGKDTFIYQRAYKATVITDFNIRPGEDDIIDMRSTFANVHGFTDLLSKAQQVGNDVVFNFGNFDTLAPFDTLTLQGQTIDELDPSQFRFSENPNSPSGAFEIFANPDIFRSVFTETAPLTDGGFVAATATINTYFQQNIFGTRFDDRGVRTGTFAFNTTPLNFGNTHTQVPQLLTLADGRIVAAWVSEDSGVANAGVIRARLFNADMTPQGADFIVNTTATFGQSNDFSIIDLTAQGSGFAVTWQVDQDPSNIINMAIRQRVFDGSGAPLGDDAVVGSIPPYIRPLGTAAGVTLTLSDGRMLRYWLDPTDGAAHDLYAQTTGDLPVKIAGGIFPTSLYAVSAIELEDGRLEFVWGVDGTYNVILDSDLYGFTLPGTTGDDTLRGGIYNDRLYGLAGNDTLIGGRGPDILDGGPGIDLVDYDASLDPVTVDLSDAAPEDGGQAHGDFLIDVENIRGTGYGDTIIGDFRANNLDGSYGDDSIDGRLGDDTIIGGRGNDTLDGGGGRDTVRGGAGNDTIILRGSDGAFGFGDDGIDDFQIIANSAEAYGGNGKDDFMVEGNDNRVDVGNLGALDDITDDEARIAGNGNNVIGNRGDNVFAIEAGAFSGNFLFGQDGDDALRIWGNGEYNQLLGGVGDDTLRNLGAGDGNLLSGGEGKDTILGGGGADLITTDEEFVSAEFDTVEAKGGNDTIVSRGGADEIDGGEGYDLLTLDFSSYTGGNLAFTLLAPDQLSHVDGDGTAVIGVETVILLGGSGDDTFEGGDGDDTFHGTGNNIDAWNNVLDGGEGFDTVDYGYAGIYASLAEGRIYRTWDFNSFTGTPERQRQWPRRLHHPDRRRPWRHDRAGGVGHRQSPQ